MEAAAGAPAAIGDEAVLEALKTSVDGAFELLVRAYAVRMRSVALRILRNAADADDAVQEAFLSAFRALPRFEGRSGLGTWLQRIQINAALMKLRAKRPAEALEEGDVDELLPRFVGLGVHEEHLRPWGAAPDAPAVREELCASVRAGIDGLPEKFRIPLLLRDIEGLSNDELAQELGISVNAAKIRVHRARQALRALLEPTWRSLVP